MTDQVADRVSRKPISPHQAALFLSDDDNTEPLPPGCRVRWTGQAWELELIEQWDGERFIPRDLAASPAEPEPKRKGMLRRKKKAK